MYVALTWAYGRRNMSKIGTLTGERAARRRPFQGAGAVALALALFLSLAATLSPTTATPAVAQAAPGVGDLPDGWEVSPEPVTDWGVATLLESQTVEFNSLVFDFAELDGVVYVAGRFGHVTDGWGRPQHDQPYLAAFDADTGEYLPGFAPQLDGPAFALASDGNRLFVGGEFASVGGVATGPLAAVDPATGALRTGWLPDLRWDDGDAVVMDIELAHDSVYVGGNFLYAGDQLAPRLAKLSLTDASHDPTFGAVVSGARVWTIEHSPDRSRLYVGGYFEVINGAAHRWFATLDAFTGELTPGVAQGTPAGMPNCCKQNVFDIATYGDRVYVARESHLLEVLDATDLSRIGFYITSFGGGDFQAAEIVGDRLYAGGHYWSNHAYDTRSITTNPGNEWRAYNVEALGLDTQRPAIWASAFDAATGADLPDFLLDMGASAGVWAIHGSENGRLWLGGDLSRAGSGWVGGFAVFEAAPAPELGPDLAAGAATAASSTRASFGPEYAIDGHLAGHTHHDGVRAQFAETLLEDDPWLEIDLGAVRDIGTIRLFERAVGNYNGLSDGVVFVSDSPFTSTDPDTTRAQPGVTSFDTPTIGRWSDLEIGRTGRYVRIQLPGELRRLTADSIRIYEAVDLRPTLDAPSFLRSTRQERRRVVLNWDEVAGAERYEVRRDGAVITLDDNGWFTDTGLAEATSYAYEVRAVGADGRLGAPAQLTVSTVGDVAAPTVRITRVERRKIVVNYDVVDGADGYRILVDDEVVTIDDNRWHVITGLEPGTTYEVAVQAVAGTATGPATTIEVTTLP